MNIPLISNALTVANDVHKGVFRKYHDPREPYIQHPKRVADRFSRLDLPEPTLTVGIAAAFTHDTLEDKRADGTFLSPEELESATSYEVRVLVEELTNPSKQFPDLARADRKALDRDHIRQISSVAKMIKLIDRADNLRSMKGAPRDFIELYVMESKLLFAALTEMPPTRCKGLSCRMRSIDFELLRHEYVSAVAEALKYANLATSASFRFKTH